MTPTMADIRRGVVKVRPAGLRQPGKLEEDKLLKSQEK
jgi:hypothetical protein